MHAGKVRRRGIEQFDRVGEGQIWICRPQRRQRRQPLLTLQCHALLEEHRGGTLTLAVANPPATYEQPIPKSLDPASGASAWELLTLTNDGLLGYSQAGGAETYTVRGLVLEDQVGVSHRAVGAERFGETFNAQTGGTRATYVFKFQILGTSDSLNLVMRFSPSGEFSEFGPGTCSAS